MSQQMQWSKFYWGDWARDPALRLCSFAAKGLWMDMMCQMDACDERGFLLVAGRAATAIEIAKMVGGERRAVERLLLELEANGVFSRDSRGAIFSRRMTRDCAISQQNIDNGKRGGNPALLKNNNLTEKPLNPPVKAETETERERESERKKDPIGSKARSENFDMLQQPSKAAEKAKNPIAIVAELPPWMPLRAWSEFVASRKQSKHPITPAAMKALLRTLEDFHRRGLDVEAALDTSTAAGWRGVFEPKSKSTSARAPQKTAYQADLAAKLADLGLMPSEPENFMTIDGSMFEEARR